MPFWRDAVPRLPASLLSGRTPVEATSVLCDRLPDDARVYQDFAFASYQEWACPRLPVFSDTRLELYPFEQWADYFVVAGGLDGLGGDAQFVRHLTSLPQPRAAARSDRTGPRVRLLALALSR